MNNCPVCETETGFSGIPLSDCPFDIKQIQRLAFSIEGKVIWDSGNGIGGDGTGVPQLDSQIDSIDDWNVRVQEADGSLTKIVLFPLIGGDPVIEAGEAITEGGGDNSTLNGVEVNKGTSPSKLSYIHKSISPAQEKAMKKIACKRTEVILLLEGNRIACRKIEGSEHHVGFQVESLFVSDRNNNGFASSDTHKVSLSLTSGWSEDMVIIPVSDWNPVYDLV